MKKGIIIGFSLLICIAVLVSLVFTDGGIITMGTYKNSYNYVVKENKEEIKLEMLLNQDNSIYVQKEAVENAKIIDDYTLDEIKLSLEDITYQALEKVGYKIYYKYLFSFEIDLSGYEETTISFKNAILVLQYEKEQLDFEIGSFLISKQTSIYSSEDNIEICQIKGIKNNIGEFETLVCIALCLNNKLDETIKIKNIEIIDSNLKASLYFVKCSEIEEKIENNTDIIAFLDNGYNYQVQKSHSNITLEASQTKYLYIPLCMFPDYAINKVGFKISYEVLGEDYEIIYPPFLFYTSTRRSNYEVSKLEFKELGSH